MKTLGSSIEESQDFALVAVAVGSRLQPLPGGVDHVQYEGEAELTWREVMTAGGEGHDGTHQIVGHDCDTQFFLHHAFDASRHVMQPDGPFQRTQIGFDPPALAVKGHDLRPPKLEG